MKIYYKHIISSFLIFFFITGLAHNLVLQYRADSNIVFDLEQQDSQDGSESDTDEEEVDINLHNIHTNQIAANPKTNMFSIYSNIHLYIELIGVSQPTPPPEYLG